MKSTVGFILALIGGIFSILGGIMVVIEILVQVWTMQLLQNSPTMSAFSQKSIPLFNPNFLIIMAVIGFLWFLVIGILGIVSSIMMNKEDNNKVKKGGIMALVVGILGLNILTILGGIFGIIDSKK